MKLYMNFYLTKGFLTDNDVQVESSLPPAVQGQLRCFLVVKVDCIAWKIKNHPKDVQVCLKWWGQIDDGTIFWCEAALLAVLSFIVEMKHFSKLKNKLRVLKIVSERYLGGGGVICSPTKEISI